MGFVVTTPTDLPTNGDGSQDQLTWAESGGALIVPPSEGPGYGGAVPLPSNDVDYEWRQGGRWSRATVNRSVLSDEGWLSSCILKQGTFNLNGGTLDITLTPTRVVVDADGDGGVVLEIKATTPETLGASRDTYLNINEAGSIELQVVGNGDPAPVPTAGYVAIWLLETDATELINADPVSGIAPFPCLAEVGARSLVAEELNVVGPSIIGENATHTCVVNATTSFVEDIDAEGGLTVAAGQTLTANGDCVLGDSAGDAIIVPGTITAQQTVQLSAGAEIAAFTPASIGQYGRSSNGDLLYHNGDRVQAPGLRVFQSQEGSTGAAGIVTTLQTTKRQDAPVTLMVTVTLYATRAAAGLVGFQIEQSDAGLNWSNLGNGFSEPNVGTAQTLIKFSRFQVGVDTVTRLYRVVANAGASTVDIEEGILEITPAE